MKNRFTWASLVFVAMMLLLGMRLLIPATALAAGTATFKNKFLINGQQYTVTRLESTNLKGARSVSCTGTFTTASGQSLVSTYIYFIIPAGTGTAMGTVNATAKTYADAVGDPDLKQYYLRFTISQGGNKYSYSSPTYTFGKQ